MNYDRNSTRFLIGVLLTFFLSNALIGNAAIWQWSTTPASNASADPNINWREGQAPSSINDSARSMMAQLAFWRDSFSGALTTGGTSTAYTLTTNLSLAATPNNGQFLCFVPHVTNGADLVLSADGGSNFPIQTAPGVAVSSGTLVQGTPYCVSFNSSASSWVLFSSYANPFDVPLGTVLDYTGATAPNSSFVLAFGQAISRTTYANYFALVSTTFGSGDGTTTFNVPDLRGRMIAGVDNMGGVAANRITIAGGNFDGTALGGTGGAQNHTLTASELALHTHSITDPGHTHVDNTINTSAVSYCCTGGNAGSFGLFISSPPNTTTTTGSSTTGISATNTAGGSTPPGGAAHTILSPAMVLSKIIRIQHHDDDFARQMIGFDNDNEIMTARAVGE